ncbi:unnamed protein product [Paramecium sonneborni]|uniref:MORN repeat protein n=1 Tax=Paramecium sonneborni TaxID=65129 RepID=A0A8S1RSD4_9CILI|nr:unnamed protein product [Paramecium sonneborni]
MTFKSLYKRPSDYIKIESGRKVKLLIFFEQMTLSKQLISYNQFKALFSQKKFTNYNIFNNDSTQYLFRLNIQQFAKKKLYNFYFQKMNSATQNNSILLKSMIKKYGTKNYEDKQLDQMLLKLFKANILVSITQDNKIIYSQDGVILRIEQIQDSSKDFELLTNKEQINNQYWRAGKWTAVWKEEVLSLVGGYYRYGLKQGQWCELTMNYWRNNRYQVYEIGEYYNDKKYGQWIYLHDNQKISGGWYDENGQKNGKWNELSDGFMNESQVIYVGEYKNGKKLVCGIFYIGGIKINDSKKLVEEYMIKLAQLRLEDGLNRMKIN